MKLPTVERFRGWLLGEREVVAALSITAADNISSLAEVAGMITMPGVPALLSGLSLYFALMASGTWSPAAIIAVALVVVISLECLGIAASKTAMKLYRSWRDQLSTQGEFMAVVVTTTLYALLVFGIVYMGRGLPSELQALGYASPFLAVAMYVVIGFNADLQQRRDQLLAASQRETEFENQQRIAELEDAARRLKMKREQEMQEFAQKLELKRLKAEARLLETQADLIQMSPGERFAKTCEMVRKNAKISPRELQMVVGTTERNCQMLLRRAREEVSRDER